MLGQYEDPSLKPRTHVEKPAVQMLTLSALERQRREDPRLTNQPVQPYSLAEISEPIRKPRGKRTAQRLMHELASHTRAHMCNPHAYSRSRINGWVDE